MRLAAKSFVAVLLAVGLLFAVGPANAQLWGTTYQFYPSPGYYNDGTLYYLMTDSSDATYASTFRSLLGFPVNYTPLLANCLAPALRTFNDDPTNPMQYIEFMPIVYYVTNAPTSLMPRQYLVFSAQWPVPFPGSVPPPPPPTAPPFPKYAPGTYMPLWRLELVEWDVPGDAVTLTCQQDIIDAEDAGDVTITEPGIVIGATILVNTLGAKIPQASVFTVAGRKLVRMPIRPVYVGGQVWKIIQTDFSNPYAVYVNRGTYAPWLNRFNALRQMQPGALASQIIYSFWPQPPIQQLYLLSQRPNPIGPSNANASYSPLTNEWIARALGITPIYTNATAAGFLALTKTPTNYLAYQPVVGQ